jgi:hypothetical protein
MYNDPLVVHAYVTNSAAETNVRVPVPWDDVKCTYIYSLVETAIDGDGAMAVTFEFNAADGTTIATMSVDASATVGTVDEATFATPNTAGNLFAKDTYMNISIDGSTTGTGALNIYMYFEPIL